jgi:hypothetical protein
MTPAPQGSGPRRHDRGEVCPDCDAAGHPHIHDRCLGHAKHTNDERRAAAIERWGHGAPWPCERPPLDGLEVCQHHGGSTGKSKAKAAERVEEARVLGRMGKLMAEAGAVTDDLQDHEALLGVIRKIRRMVWALDWMIEGSETPLGVNRFGEQVEHPLVAMHLKYAALLGNMEEGALKLGLAVRRQQFHESQVAQIGAMVRELVTGLGRTLDDPEVVPVVERALALVAEGEAA